MTRLRFRFLGPPQIELDGVVRDLHSRKALALVAYLAMTGRSHSRARLATLLWPERSQDRALAYLRHSLWKIRSALGEDLLPSEQDLIAFQPHTIHELDFRLDVNEFQERLRFSFTARGGTDESSPLAQLEVAVSFYRDDFLAGFTLRDAPDFDDWQYFEREALRNGMTGALERLVDGYTAMGRFDAAATHARRWVAMDPLHEPAHRQLMRLYTWHGRRAAALRQFQEVARILRDELDAEPTKPTMDLFHAIRENRLDQPPIPAIDRAAADEEAAESTVVTVNSERLSPRHLAAASDTQTLEEIRVLTVLCVGLTELPGTNETSSPEDAAERVAALLQQTQARLKRFEGEIVQVLGDRFLAVLGAQRIHEDDPERAVNAAWDLRNQARRWELRLGMGIHTGSVLLRNTSARHDSAAADMTRPLVLGPIVDLAVRLQSHCAADDILVSKATHHQARGAFVFHPVALSLHDPSPPTTAYLAVRPRSRPAKARGLDGFGAAFVGRERELAQGRTAVETLYRGEGHLLILTGDAGVGKSRLVTELKGHAADFAPAGPTLLWLEGRSQEMATQTGYWPFIDLLQQQLVVGTQDDVDAVRARITADLDRLQRAGALDESQVSHLHLYLSVLLGVHLESARTEAGTGVEQDRRRHESLVALGNYLAALARVQPLVLVLEDLHWADTLSLDLLILLMEKLAVLPMLVVCIYRPGTDHQCDQLGPIAAGKCPERVTEIRLQELSAAQTRTLVASHLTGAKLPAELYDHMLEKSQGNPLFVEEVIHSLIEVGALYRVARGWAVQMELAGSTIPNSLQHLIRARTERLPAHLRYLVQCASVIGRTFSESLLASLVTHTSGITELSAALQELTFRAFLFRDRVTPEPSYTFRHVLVQESVASSLLSADREELHRTVARRLEATPPSQRSTLFEMLAHHWERGAQPDKAIYYWQQAGDRARLAYAQAEAVHGYQHALALAMEHGQYGQAARIHMKLGLTLQNAGDFDAAHRAFDQGFALWQHASMQAEPSAAAPTQTLHLLTSPPQSLDPARASDEMSENVVQQLFSGLVALTPDLGIEPDVAHSWHLFNGGQAYRFQLRTDVTWCDGTPVTAHDFACAWRRVLSPANPWGTAAGLYAIRGAEAWHTGVEKDVGNVGIRVEDDYTLTVELETPTGDFLALLTQSMALPVPRHLVAEHGDAWPEAGTLVSNGPFLLAERHRGGEIRLTANPAYHGGRRGNVRELWLHIQSSAVDALQDYEDGLLDALPLGDLLTDERDRIRRRHMDDYLLAPRLATIFLSLDPGSPPFADRRVRQALAHAIDRVTLAGDTLRGDDYPASGMLPSGMPGHSPDTGLHYDPDRARHLLADAGYPGGLGFPPVDAQAWPGIEPICHAVSRQWRQELGIEIDWTLSAWSNFIDLSRRSAPALFPYGWAFTTPGADSLLRRHYGSVLIRWQNDEYHEIVAAAERTQHQQQRVDLYRTADRLLCTAAPVIPLLYERLHLLVKPHVKAFPTSAVKWNFWRDVIVERDPALAEQQNGLQRDERVVARDRATE